MLIMSQKSYGRRSFQRGRLRKNMGTGASHLLIYFVDCQRLRAIIAHMTGKYLLQKVTYNQSGLLAGNLSRH